MEGNKYILKKLIAIYIDSFRGLSNAAWLLAIVMLINRMGSMVIPFLGIYMTSSLGFTLENVGLVLMCYGLGSVCGSWLGGWLTDKIGNFIVQAVSLLLSVPLFLLVPEFKDLQSVCLMIFILSLVADTFRPANSVSVARYAKPENITRAFSLNRLAVNLGFSVGPAMGGFLATYSYAWIFYGNALAAGIAGIVFIAFFWNKKGNALPISKKKETDSLVKDPSPYKDLPFIGFSICCCLFSVCFFQIMSTLPLFYKDVHHMTEPQMGVIMGFSGFIIVLFEMFVVHVAEKRLSVVRTLVYGSILCSISFLLLNVHAGWSMLYVAIFILGIGEMLTLPFMATVTAERATPSTQGAYMGLNALSFALANIISPFFGTRIVSNFGYDTLWYGTSALLLITGLGFYYTVKRLAK